MFTAIPILPGPGRMVTNAASPSLIFSKGTAPPAALLILVSVVTWKTKLLPNLIVIVFAASFTAVTCPKKACRSAAGAGFAQVKAAKRKPKSVAAKVIRGRILPLSNEEPKQQTNLPRHHGQKSLLILLRLTR